MSKNRRGGRPKGIKPITTPPERKSEFVRIEDAHVLAKELMGKSDKSPDEIAACIGVSREMLYVGLRSDNYVWIVEGVFRCLGYVASIGVDLRMPKKTKTPKGEG